MSTVINVEIDVQFDNSDCMKRTIEAMSDCSVVCGTTIFDPKAQRTGDRTLNLKFWCKNGLADPEGLLEWLEHRGAEMVMMSAIDYDNGLKTEWSNI